jgi:hypothetical protein
MNEEQFGPRDANRPYARAFGDEDGWKKLKPTVQADALVLRDECPVCGHPIEDLVSLSREWLKGVGEDPSKEPSIVTVVTCNCEVAHERQPKDRTGCGASAVLTVEIYRDENGCPTARVKRARAATSGDRSWDAEASNWEKGLARAVSTTAEKWGATVAAIFGVFTFALVLENERVTEVLHSDATWPWWVATGFLGLIGAACLLYGTRWRREPGEPTDRLLQSIGGLALVAAVGCGVLGLVVEPRAGWSFGLIAGGVFALGLAATMLSGLAAQGSPKWVPYFTGPLMRQRRLEKATATVRDLRRARVATALAVTGLVAALGLLWYAPDPDPQLVLAKTKDGTNPCGAIAAHQGVGLALDPPGAQALVDIDPDELIQLTPTDKC